jgi:hypothetical protein
MNAQQWLITIALGAMMGLVGQSIRAVVGLKKLKDESAATGQSFADAFEPSILLVSLLIGATAGALAAIPTVGGATNIPPEALLGLVAAGYSGADFIEGAMSKYLPGIADPDNPLQGQINPPIPRPGTPSPPPAPGSTTVLAQPRAGVTPFP